VAGFWNDMNEPAVFDLPGKTLPADCRHTTDFGPRRHAEVHNVYGSAMARASFEGARRHAPGERPFVISRAGYAGIQRHAVVWTGDNSSTWEHLAESIPMLLNLGLSGVPFCGADAGGFLDHATGELLARWTQLAAFTPFFRNHSNEGTHRQEPWAFGAEVEGICRGYITLRYQLRPYFYCLMAEAAAQGTPIMRPMAWHYQNDPEAVACGDQFLLGPSLLVAPILRPGATARSVYLPVGNWFDYWTGEFHLGRRHIAARADLATLPLFVRAGAIVPMTSPTQSVPDQPEDTITLQVWPGAPGELDYYEDDGQTLTPEAASARWQTIRLRPQARGASMRWDAPRGTLPSRVRRWQVCFLQAPRAYRVVVDGRELDRNFHAPTGTLVFEVPQLERATTIRLR
jgi:alpha-glucosidase